MVSRSLDETSVFPPKDPRNLLYQDIRSRISQHDFETWFQATPCDYYHPDRFVFTAPNRFRKAWMEKNYRDLLRDSARSLFKVDPLIEFEVRESQASPYARTFSTEKTPEAGAARKNASASASAPPSTLAATSSQVYEPSRLPAQQPSPVRSGDQPKLCPTDLNSNFSFETFVAGPPNRVAHAGAIAVSELPGKSYSPLYIYGDRGVGKTHLLQAICHRLFHFTQAKVVYFTSESFLSQFVSAISDSSIDDFRTLCRSADVLVIDDVHFLANKEKTQDELFYTLNELLSHQRQVIVSSVGSPRETPGIQERLVSRFKWGLVTRLEQPDFEMRVAVLLRKGRVYGQELPVDVAEFIAKHVTDNLREVEGALARVVSVASLHQSPICLSMARIALRELLQEEQTAGTITVGQILNAVREYYEIRPKDLLSRSKVRALVHARQMGMYLARQLTPMSLEEIGAHFGGRDHTTVLYALDRITEQLKTKPRVRGDLQLLKSRLSSLRSL